MEHEELELLLDRYGPHDIAAALAHVCGEKADHVRSAWQDEELAKAWERAAREFDKCADKLPS